MKSPELKAKGDVDIRGGNYSKGLNKQDVNLTDRLLKGRGIPAVFSLLKIRPPAIPI